MKSLKKCVVGAIMACAMLPSAAQSQGNPILFGYQFNYLLPSSVTPGMYRLPTSGLSTELLWQDPLSAMGGGSAMVAGWYRDGVVCGYESNYPLPSQAFYKYVERDLETGELKKEINVDIASDWTNFFLNAAYCPDDNRIYGYGFNSTRTAFAFKYAPADRPDQAVIIKEVGTTYPGSICYNHETGAFYGIMNEKDWDNDGYNIYVNSFVSIDVNTGEMTKIMKLQPDGTPYIYNKCVGGLIWVPSRQAYLWNYYTEYDAVYDEVGYKPCSKLIEIKPDKKTLTEVRSFDKKLNFFYFIAKDNDPVAAAGAPAPILDFKAQVDDNKKANLSFKLPNEYADGKALEGEVSYEIYVDGKSVTNGTGQAGTEIKYSVSLTDGTHFICVVPTVNNVNGLAQIHMVYIGFDSPLAPENVVLTENELKWDAVTKGMAGNAISDVTYRVEINGMMIAETKDTKVSVKDIVLTDAPLERYQAKVQAVYYGRASKEAYSNSIIVGEPWSVPFTIFPDPKQYSVMEQEDVDGNNIMWSLDKSETDDSYNLTSGFDRTGPSDDWIFMPKFKAEANKAYSFTFHLFLADTELSGAKVEAWIGDAPSKSAMKKVIIPAIKILGDNSDATYTGQFYVDGDLAGKDLYIGLGVSSGETELSPVRFNNLKVEEAEVSNDGPVGVSNLVAMPMDDNMAKATVSFNLPTTTLAGAQIPAGSTIETMIQVQGGGFAEASGKPGEPISVNIETGSGQHLITVTTICDGETGLSVNCVSGGDLSLPGLVRNLRMAYSEDNCSLRLDWDAPDTDAEGKPVTGDKYSYNIWQHNGEAYELVRKVDYPLHFATLDVTDLKELTSIQVAISAVNAVGDSPLLTRVHCEVGPVNTLPLEDNLNGTELKYPLDLYYQLPPYNKANFGWGDPSYSEWALTGSMKATDGDVICGYPFEAGAQGRIDLPKVSTEKCGLRLNLNLYTGENAATTIVKGIYASSDTFVSENNGVTYYPEMEKEVETIQGGKSSGYETIGIDFPHEFSRKPWITPFLDIVYPTLSSRFLLAGYSMTKTSGVEGVTETIYGTIFGSTGKIIITGYQGERVNVYTLGGGVAASELITGSSIEMPVNAGVYVVKVGNRVEKVIVR